MERNEPSQSAGSDDAVNRARVLTGFRNSALILMLALPPLVYYMWICVTYYGGAMQFPTSGAEWSEFLSHIAVPGARAWAFFFGWYLLQVALQIFAPGPWVEGVPLRDGRRLRYKMNGWFTWWVTLGLAFVLVDRGVVPATMLADDFGELLTIFNAFAFAFSLYLYVRGQRLRGADGATGKPVYDFFMGTELNPRVGDFDLKLFFEARPGLILWVLINFSFMAKQYQEHCTVTAAMLLVCLFHAFYIGDYFYNERRILSTMDIKHENFGWMLCWGDAVWVPFTYTLQAMYLVGHAHELPWWGIAAIVALNFGGFYIFRSVNSQKDDFRADPERPIWGRRPEYIRTAKGTLLLTSGWWGLARHANYMGDLMMALAWCLPTLFGSLITYFYFIYFSWLLLHREWRDDKMCAAKYGADWEEYRRRVPYRIVPGIY